ncbi:tail sheath stabilizer and completion protein [uncultured Caudovirales phage]|uniref:Tail sheath stabilizer and completion protein n=1 Tax=uncultured Caudovirales phage TaxID=2100421 RepID=A0A6J5KWF1_9CAUD|nr:tail sheath stabilizer and completion protein [uncultured Caudovirales phage]
MFNTPFYHGSIRKSIVTFGNLFSNISIERKLDDTTQQTIAIPIAYAPKEKWVVRIDQDPDLNNHTYTTLPRMSFEITGMSYDASRKLNRMNKITCYNAQDQMTSVHTPIPYNLDVSLYVLTKTQEDGLQIVEQILPFFTPDYNMSVKVIPETQTFIDVPVILNSVNVQDEYDGDFQTRRFVTYTLSFTMKTSLFGPVSESGVIETVHINTSQANYLAQGNPTTSIINENWDETI